MVDSMKESRSSKTSVSTSPFYHVVLRRSDYENVSTIKAIDQENNKGNQESPKKSTNTDLSKAINVETMSSSNTIASTQSNRTQTKIKVNRNRNRSIKSKSSFQRCKPMIMNTTTTTGSHYYSFVNENRSFCPSGLSVSHGFHIRSLLKHHQLPSWKFDPNDGNQMIYQQKVPLNRLPDSKLIDSFADREMLSANFSFSTRSYRKPSLLITCPVEHRWFQSLLNSHHQQNEEHGQLSPTVHQFSQYPSTTSSKLVSRLIRCTNKLQRTKQMTFDEHIEKYYASKYLLTTTTEKCSKAPSINTKHFSCQSNPTVCYFSFK